MNSGSETQKHHSVLAGSKIGEDDKCHWVAHEAEDGKVTMGLGTRTPLVSSVRTCCSKQ